MSDQTDIDWKDLSEKGKNPFLNGRKQWDDRFMLQAKENHAWKGFAICLVILVAILVGGIAHIGSQSKIKPYMTVVDKSNYVVHVMGPADEVASLDNKLMHNIVETEIRGFIENVRTIIADNHAQKKIMERVYSRVAARSPASKFINEWYTMVRPPFKFAETGSVSPDEIRGLPLSEKSWQIEWIERERNLTGEVLRTSRYKAILTYELETPESDKESRKNAIGFYVTNLTWSRQD